MIRSMNDIVDHAVDAYIGELARLGRSKATRTKYQEILWKFTARVDEKPLVEITRSDCTRFLDGERFPYLIVELALRAVADALEKADELDREAA